MADSEVGLGSHLGEFVPGTDELAVVTAIDPVADRRAKLLGYAAVEFYCQVRDTPSCIEFVRRNDGAGGADIDTGRTATAVFARHGVGAEWNVGIDFAEEKP